jgi:hypothetical protein
VSEKKSEEVQLTILNLSPPVNLTLHLDVGSLGGVVDRQMSLD